MGLDSVELVIAVEDRFGIYIPDARAVEILTVADLYHAVLRLRMSAAGLKCKTQHVFYRFRASLPYHLRRRCHPDAPLEDFVPQDGRKQFYDQLSATAGLQFPRLQVPTWFSDVENLTVVGVIVSALILYPAGFVFAAGLVIVMAMIILVSYLPLRHASSTLLPQQTVGAFIRAITELNYVDVLPDFRDDETLLRELRLLIVKHLGVDPSKVTMSARFQQDLGCS